VGIRSLKLIVSLSTATTVKGKIGGHILLVYMVGTFVPFVVGRLTGSCAY